MRSKNGHLNDIMIQDNDIEGVAIKFYRDLMCRLEIPGNENKLVILNYWTSISPVCNFAML